MKKQRYEWAQQQSMPRRQLLRTYFGEKLIGNKPFSRQNGHPYRIAYT